MLKYLKQILGDSLIYGLSGIISGFISIFLIPIYTKIFSPHDYGIIGLIATTFNFIYIILIFGLDNSVQFWFYHKEEISERKKTFASWTWFLFCISVILALTIILCSRIISTLLFKDEKYWLLIVLTGVNLLLVGYQRIIGFWFRTQRKVWQTVTYSLIISLINIGFNILFIVILRIGLKGVYYSQIIASVIGTILFLYFMREWLSYKYFSYQRTKEMIVFSAPLVPAVFLSWVLNSSGTYFIQYFWEKSEVGLYQIGANIAAMLGLITGAFLQAYSPFCMAVSKKDDAKHLYGLVLTLFTYVGCLGCLVLAFFSKEILIIFTNEQYYSSNMVMTVMGFNLIVTSMAQMLAVGTALSMNNKPFLISSLIGTISTIVFFLVLIPSFGKEGAAISTLAGNIILVLHLAYRVQKLYFIPYNFKQVILVFMVSILLAIIGQKTITSNLTMNIFIKSVFIVIIMVIAIRANRNIYNRLKIFIQGQI